MKRVAALLFLLFLVGFSIFGVVFVGEMRHASELMTSLPDKLRKYSTEPTRILSADGQVLYTVQSEFREPIRYEQIPKHVRDAIVAAEDKRFYEHTGVDYWAMARIMAVGAKEGRLSQGGSTLTMQLAKRFYSEGERTFRRKMQDVALAITMEREMTKEQILTLYLNTMYFGEKAYGIQAASDVYFGKPIDKLSIAEAAMLARCVRRPSDENPVKNLGKSVENRNVVLGIMRGENMISQSEYDDAIAEKPKIKPPSDRVTSHLNRAPYFVAHVLQFLEQDLPDIDLKQGGYTIKTTLDSKMEDYAEKMVLSFVRQHRGDRVNTAAFVLIDKDGKILSEVGGIDYGKSQFNIVTQGFLQPGSSFKPFLYSTALSTGVLSLGDRLDNQPFSYDMGLHAKPWPVHNSSPRENSGPVSVERAVALSLNIPAAHVMERIGNPQTVKDLAVGAFGFPANLEANPSMALGTSLVRPIDMAQGYSVFMLHGDRVTPYCVTQVIGPDDTVVRSYEPKVFRNALDSRIAFAIEDLLKAVVDYGTGWQAKVVPNARGKTGTTSDHKDIWFCGYADGVLGVAWAGNNVVRRGRVYQLPMGSQMWGATAASEMWVDIMKKAHSRFGTPLPETPPPSDSESNPKPDNPEPETDTVRVTKPDANPPDGTTGGDGTTNPNLMPPTVGGGGTTGGTATPPPDYDPNGPPPDATPPTAKPPRREPPKRHDEGDNQNDMVQVEVCAETGMRATIYCPETIVRTFRRGREPKRHCTLHGG